MTAPTTVIGTEVFPAYPQADGRSYVTEKHSLSDGKTIETIYLADQGLDIYAVAYERASMINSKMAAEQAAIDTASSFDPPISVAEFIDMLPIEISVGLMQARKTDPSVDLAITRLMVGEWVYKHKLQEWLGKLVTAQSMTQETADAIIASWPDAEGVA